MQKIIFSLFVLLFPGLCVTAVPEKFTQLPELIQKAPSDARWAVPYNITEDIDLASKLLAKEKAGYWFRNEMQSFTVIKHGKKIIKKKMVRVLAFNILLAVENVKDRLVKIIKISQDGGNNKGYSVDWSKANGMNTDFNVTVPEGHIVLGAKRVVKSADGGWEEVVYTPYTHDLDTQVMRSRGLTYLKSRLVTASRLLEEQNVLSQTFKGSLVSSVVPDDVALVLSIIEHIDPSRMEEEKIERLVNEVLVIVAANRERSYRYAVSKAGARDLFQFIPSTYHSVRAMYPKAKLIPDFVSGMRNHVNGAEASLLLFDSDLSQLPAEYRDQAKKSKAFLADYLAAAYNCGAPNTAKALKHGKKWVEHLPKETRLYLMKLHEAKRVLGISWK
ncbi:MAG: hypothetical protein WCG73_02320 [Candidatus Moraniibacteriota bacterium]